MDHLPNIAEAMLARAIGTCGRPDFEPALWEFLRRAVTADNMIVIAYRAGGAPVALWRHAAEPFHHNQQSEDGSPLSRG